MSSGYFPEKQKENIKPKERLSCSAHHLLIKYFIFLATLNLSVSLVHYMLQISLIVFQLDGAKPITATLNDLQLHFKIRKKFEP